MLEEEIKGNLELEVTSASSGSGVSILLKSKSFKLSVRPELEAATDMAQPW